MKRLPIALASLAALAAGIAPLSVSAQSIDYGDVSQGGNAASSGPYGDGSGGDTRRSRRGDRKVAAKTRDITPYIEVAQIFKGEVSPNNEVLTYSRVAAGVDGVVTNRQSGVAFSLRYERDFSWQDSRGDQDFASGLANGYVAVAPGVQLRAGGLATRYTVDDSGTVADGLVANQDTVVQVYSVYAGPSVATNVGDVGIQANYRAGYSKIEQADAFRVDAGGNPLDTFDDSVVHVADVTAGVKPDTALPIGVGVGGSYYREDISNLDQRVEDMQANANVTVPLGPSLAVTGRVGYEKVEVSHRDAVRDAEGEAIRGDDGRFISDKTAPREIAYDVDGLIWDVGVVWKPSRRTSLTANVGRRYGSTSYTGVLTYAPSRRSAFALAVYDNVAGFGGQLNRSLADLPTDFTAIRNPLTGDIGGCVSSLEDGNCLSGALGSLRSATFRARGIAGSYTRKFGRFKGGLGAGYDRRKFIGATGTVLETANGLIDEKYWLSGYLDAEIDQNSGISTYLYANWIESGGGLGSDGSNLGASGFYYRKLTDRLKAKAALGIDGYETDSLPDDIWVASGQVGVLYSF